MSKKNLKELIVGKSNKEVSALIKDWLKSAEKELYSKFKNKGIEGCEAFTNVMDEIVTALYLTCPTALPKKETAIIALGGYGRKELNLSSDVDLMLLYDGEITEEVKSIADRLTYSMWDIGIDLAFSIRSVKDCLSIGAEDIKTLTSFIDARLIYGNKTLFESLNEKVYKKFFSSRKLNSFLKEKMKESEARGQKFGGSIYILEPNIKEGDGGLRDYHTARWFAMVNSNGDFKPVKSGLLNRDEYNDLQEAIDYLLKTRNALHSFRSGKKQDQLTFDAQSHIANEFKYKNTDSSLAVEKFMQQYFKHATVIKILTARMTSRLIDNDEKAAKKNKIWPLKLKKNDKVLDDDFIISDGRIVARNKKVFEDNPVNIMTAFYHFHANNALFERSTKDSLLLNLKKVNTSFRKNKECADMFLSILNGKSYIYRTLLEMHRTGFLDRYIPEFGNIRCKMQHDMYHVFTVDTHTLFAVREFERLKNEKEYKEKFPTISGIVGEVKNQAPLVLGIMFHDIGKALGKGHSEKGAKLVPEICSRLHMSTDDIAMVEFLVLKHLILANTAQYRDIYDEKLIIDFSKTVGYVDRLKHLYALTFCDVRAVGPEVWTEWKSGLFKELYFRSLSTLERGTYEPEDSQKRVDEVMLKVLEIKGADKAEVENYFKMLPHRYFLSTEPKMIYDHIAIVKQAEDEKVAIGLTHNKKRKYTELTVSTQDIHSLFAMITGVMAAQNINIIDAKINTLKNGLALDALQLNDLEGNFLSNEEKTIRMVENLKKVISGEVSIKKLLEKKKESILDKRNIPMIHPKVVIDNECSEKYTVIDIRAFDRVGLLYTVADTLLKLGLTVHIAKISTKGAEAADIFYVTDIFGQKIHYDEKLKNIVDAIYEAIEIKKEQRSA